MPAFNASAAIEPLEYDFAPYQPEVKGVIPEPSEEQVQTYFKAVTKAAEGVRHLRATADKVQQGGEIDGDNPDVAALMEEMENFDMAGMLRSITEAVADLCSGQPTADQIQALPFRVRQEFVKWVGSQFRSK